MSFEGFTTKIQQLIVKCYEENGINNETQNLFHPVRFFVAIAWLKKNNLIQKICPVCRKRLKEYECCTKKDYLHRQIKRSVSHFVLTWRGEIVAWFLRGLKQPNLEGNEIIQTKEKND